MFVASRNPSKLPASRAWRIRRDRRDTDLDLVLAQAPGANQLLLNDGTGHFSLAPATALPSPPQVSMDVALADVDGDGDVDLLVASRWLT